MLFFIWFDFCAWFKITFKYISCYSLSPYGYINCVEYRHLNTSHVILYQYFYQDENTKTKNLNTSHVILYHEEFTDPLIPMHDLNTSHVILYRIDEELPF